jgi:hypothetical protein
MVGCASRERPQRHTHKAAATSAGRRTNPKPAGIQARASADLQTRDLIFIVADKREGRHSRQRFRLVHVYADTKAGIAPQHRPNREYERDPFDMAVALLFLALAHDMRIETNPRIIHEYAAVDLETVHCATSMMTWPAQICS